jgi:hypothetical protein
MTWCCTKALAFNLAPANIAVTSRAHAIQAAMFSMLLTSTRTHSAAPISASELSRRQLDGFQRTSCAMRCAHADFRVLSTFLKFSVLSGRKIAHRTGRPASLGRNCQYCLQLRHEFCNSCQQITEVWPTLFSKGSYALGHCGWYTELDHCNVALCHSQGVTCAGKQCRCAYPCPRCP